ncbi:MULTISPECIES: Ldh family oxidoreductase [unclassified Halomonas]|uniref:Ldh family oxidoreductase n=1 Tax=unclassified Halomonas TaxID=2609666 RepID=UPI00209FA114|nr:MULTISPECIES: Ldh family oxidoreductase [unclassified Halomonas]MCP1312871.1 Ldh family oxidoreductase [Halomonas sp. 707D7]MCP1326828.1 Ldh family oxidoreductase [Halomonas sp. 707D4]
MSETIILTLEEATSLSLDVLRHNGYSPAHAEAITRSVVAAQRDECHSHGLYRLIGCVETARNAGVDTQALPVVHDQAPGVVRIDAQRGCSLLAFETGLPTLIEKARRQGLAAMAINRCFHFSALWPEVEAISSQGLVGIAMTPTHPFVAPAGGTRPLLGTNPLAFSWPRPDGAPYTFDFATSEVARGEIELHRRAGKSIPAHWAMDGEGNPTTDPAAALAGAMRTFGGHKGSALSTMIGLLAGPLIGDVLGHETAPANAEGTGKPFHGELVIALSPQAFLGSEAEHHLRHAETLFDEILGQGARLPSQRRFEARERTRRDDMRLPKALVDELKELMR